MRFFIPPFVLLMFPLSLFVFHSCIHATSATTEESEKEAIRKVIALETESYYRQDFETWKSTYVDSPYFRSYGYWEGYDDKVRYFNGFDDLEAAKKKQFEENKTIWTGSTETRENENIRVSSDMAWYTFEQKSVSKEGKFLGKSLEVRVLEKHQGKWKIAMLGFYYFPLDSTRQQ
jgi:hypothetical protein